MDQDLKLRFPISKISYWAERYGYEEVEVAIEQRTAPAARKRGYLQKDEFLEICRWKTRRTQPRCKRNPDAMVHEVTRLALSSEVEQFRIEVLTLLQGVGWPTASVILHFCHRDPYPILDFRALWSCGVDVPNGYDFPFWWKYVEFCRRIAKEADVTMRILDRALWQYSKEGTVLISV